MERADVLADYKFDSKKWEYINNEELQQRPIFYTTPSKNI
jgi:hypothetical protein